MKRKRTNDDYIHFFHTYIYKWIVYVVILLLTVCFLFLFQKELRSLWNRITNQHVETETFLYNDIALADYEGSVKIINQKGSIIYEGMYQQGACNGKGVIYHNDGYPIYEGNLNNNVMEDSKGIFYHKNGNVAYKGEVANNQRNGKGRAYREDESLAYEGEFLLDLYEGIGKEYDKNGYIEYEGTFLNGVRHGTGILYESGQYARMIYKGDFAFHQPQGVGTLYDTFGKAYYTGAMFEGHINYTSFIPSTLEAIEACFQTPYDIYVYQGETIIVFPDEKLLFFSQYPIALDKKTATWSIKPDVKKKDILMRSALMVDRNIDDPNVDFTWEEILTTWQAKYHAHETRELMDANDVLAIYFTDNEAFAEQKQYCKRIAHGNRIYELTYRNYMEFTKRILYPVTKYSIGYGYPVDEKELLYTIMFEENWKVKAK